jgi:hypothetical protein
MIVADVSFIDIFWSMLEFFFLFIWILILFHVFGDLFRDHSLSGGAKTLWVLFLVFLPFVAVFVYLIARGQGMAERAAARHRRRLAHRADRPGQEAAGRWHDRPVGVRPAEGQGPLLSAGS